MIVPLLYRWLSTTDFISALGRKYSPLVLVLVVHRTLVVVIPLNIPQPARSRHRLIRCRLDGHICVQVKGLCITRTILQLYFALHEWPAGLLYQ